ncbi:MAG: mechanosensitive ion channel family protein [Treponema sp.]|jgi:small-conductance mechanosensitive channel|nr:mechanosensitive ion channel family protein [Treponema sp.]
MRKILLVIFVLLPLTLSFSQEGGVENPVSVDEQASGENSPEPQTDEAQVIKKDETAAPAVNDADIRAAVKIIDDASRAKRITADVLSSASLIKQKEGKELSLVKRIIIAVSIIVIQALLIWLIWYLFKRLNIKLECSGKNIIKPFTVGKSRILSAMQIIKMIEVLLKIIKILITALQLFLTIPIVFSLFKATKNLASTLFGYILNPLKDIALGVVGYIPNLFKIVIIVIITRYVLHGLKYLAEKIEKGKLVLPGFYPDWAYPTLKIFQVLLWAFTVAIVYPYLPGSDSRAFQGVSVFVGIIFSIGSTSAIGNLVAGFVITYMRPFKTGDRVQIKGITGFVVEKNLMVVRLKTDKNEYVTFPNIMILGSDITNYNTSSGDDEEGLIIHAEVTFGYSTPWQTVHDILINAALATDHVQKKPVPFVLQTKLDDFYACYQINCYTKDVKTVPRIYAKLHENIQNGFREAGLDMTSAHYRSMIKN